MGSKCGIAAYELASRYFDASIMAEPFKLSAQRVSSTLYELIWDANRGLNYQLDVSTDLSVWAPASLPIRAETPTMLQSYDPASSTSDVTFFRVRQIE